MSKEKVTYITYDHGIDAKHLHLGNLVHDFKHPKDYEPYVEKAYTDPSEEAPSWAASTRLQNYALTLSRENEERDEDSADESEGQRYRVVAAAKSTKLEIKDPQKFFAETTLKSPSAKIWLSSHLSAAAKLSQSHAPPPIYILTGLILMTHATWTSLSTPQTFTPGLQAPFDPTGVTAIRRSSVSEHVKPVIGFDDTVSGVGEGKRVGDTVIHETGKYPGTRGWALRWEKVEVKVLGKGENAGDKGVVVKRGNGEERIAALALEGVPVVDDEEEEEEEDDEEYWDKFLDAIEEFEKEV